MENLTLPWAQEAALPWSLSGGTYQISINADLYSREAVLKTCYLFLDQCYLFVTIDHEKSSEIKIYFSQSNDTTDLKKLMGEFSNRLMWQEVRQRVGAETQVVREIIVAQAFAEGGILDHSSVEADYNVDPLGIAQ